MALPSIAASSNPRRPKPSAIRSFPLLCGPSTTADAQPPASANLFSDQKPSPTPLITPPPEPTSCGPGSEFVSHRGKIFKPPIAFATRQFPKACGPHAASFPKPSSGAFADVARKIHEGGDEKDTEKSSQMSDFVEGGRGFCRPESFGTKIKVEGMEEGKLNDVGRRISEEGSGLGRILENASIGKSLGGKDGEKLNRKSSLMPDFVRDGRKFGRPEGFEAKSKIEKREEELNDVVRRTSKEGSGLGKVLKNAVVGKSLGGKDGEKPIRKISLMPHFVKDGRKPYRPERSEYKDNVEDRKEKLNNVVRSISNDGNGLGKILVSDVVGRSSREKDGHKPDRKRSLMPDLAESGRSEGGKLLEVRGDRLIVLALMAAQRCPWMQGKRKSSIGFESRQKKPRVRASGNSNKS